MFLFSFTTHTSSQQTPNHHIVLYHSRDQRCMCVPKCTGAQWRQFQKRTLATKATALPAGHLAKVTHVGVPVLLDRDKLSLFREED